MFLRKFVVSRHHVMIGCDRLYVRIQRVFSSLACTDMALKHMKILRFYLASLACTDMASEHGPKLSTSHMDDMMNHIEMLAIAATLPYVMIGRGVVNLVRVITKDDSRDVVFEWELDELILS